MPIDNRVIAYIADPQKDMLALYWKDDRGKPLFSLGTTKSFLARKGREMLFATNGGMYRPDHSPAGLYVENGKTLSPLITGSGQGNFYLLPNGVFYVTKDNRAGVCTTGEYPSTKSVGFATQSGPLLIISGRIHPEFRKGSTNLNIRSGVGILPDGRALFAMSKAPINFYDFAAYFLNQGCQNALFLDGFVSRMYISEQRFMQTDGYFGVIIAVTRGRNASGR